MNAASNPPQNDAGKSVRGAKTTTLSEPNVRTIREAAKISQSQFAKLIG